MPRRTTKPTTSRRHTAAAKKPPRPKAARDRSKPTPQGAEFGAYFRQRLRDAGLTYVAFAKQVPGQQNDTMDPTMLSKIGTGVVPPPKHAATGYRGADDGEGLTKDKPWAKVLGLTGKDAEEFEFQIWLALTPPMVWTRFKDMERRLAKLS